jgi:transcription antitermination protein NusB
MKQRSRARGWALQALYAWETRGRPESPPQMLQQLDADRHIAVSSLPYARTLLETFTRNQSAVDRAVEESLSNWRLERLSVIDRNILRLGATEIMFISDVPPRVSIQEAISLAEKYSTYESPRFVNGVLDALMRAHTGSESQERA